MEASAGSAGPVQTSEHGLKANFLLIGAAPAAGAVLLTYIFIKALFNFSDPANSYTGQERLGVAPPAVIGLGMLLLEIVPAPAMAGGSE